MPFLRITLVGMTDEQMDVFARSNPHAGALPPPGPLQNASAKLVNDTEHSYIPPSPRDIQRPCPGLNTLASHGVSILLFGLLTTKSSSILRSILPHPGSHHPNKSWMHPKKASNLIRFSEYIYFADPLGRVQHGKSPRDFHHLRSLPWKSPLSIDQRSSETGENPSPPLSSVV
ncbi:hypothetical protein BS47DRAFT_1389304 [Hydnum rufescens UP504]|uniref:Heme haloperoxidase family profile domain-containing protein n=1 Tax=Hydnum rufescens UP504 TaxID=1448309 RepID=A0A9P6B5J0_9AGAM|nr:hypothetical protein BS47DRAFT_1389304 [Hydnum rufescens UP504]